MLFCIINLFSFEFSAQVGIGTTSPHASSVLEINSSNSGILIPRIALTSSTDVVTILAPEVSLLIYNTNTVIDDITPGFYFWDGNQWDRVNKEIELVYGEIYKSQSASLQLLNSSVPIEFGSVGVNQGVTANSNSFQVSQAGVYRVTYSISVYKSGGGPITLGFCLATGFTTADRIPGSFCHSNLDATKEINCVMNKIIHLNANQSIYLFPDITNTNVRVKPNSATMNIELIKAD
ncbi:hypothetical protein LX78_01038 [Xanthomarina spongicola]|uniref:Uncharacterized protein n=2 Tax=Xanthomarina spongicola TaxID=570520 RepID=A0A316DQD2_9FLAO|nr:hypothetical protein LX78_01038 [Xanthomarina spongicola]